MVMGIGVAQGIPDEPTSDDLLDLIDERDQAVAQAEQLGTLVVLLMKLVAMVDRQRRALLDRPTVDAYQAACAALEKRRIALVAALGAPERDLGFYEAVDQVADLVARNATPA
jgi:hypothetical protein